VSCQQVSPCYVVLSSYGAMGVMQSVCYGRISVKLSMSVCYVGAFC
jgi:hypothetical protein